MLLGMNYNGMHDSAVAMIDQTGELVYAVSEERRSRVKKDGRFPWGALAGIDLGKVSSLSVPYLERPPPPLGEDDLYGPQLLPASRPVPAFPERWREQLEALDRPLEFHDHHAAHAAAGLYLSRFDEALVVTSDGGAYNCALTGAIYWGGHQGLELLHGAGYCEYEALCSLYADITALLGFQPIQHEGKVTGLAAFGSPDAACEAAVLEVHAAARAVEGRTPLYEWVGFLGERASPVMEVNRALAERLSLRLAGYSREDIAAAAQRIIERRTLQVMKHLRDHHGAVPLVLSGGMFANVKLNMLIKRLGFPAVFVCPPMGDEGASIGAAVLTFAREAGGRFPGRSGSGMFLGRDPAGTAAAGNAVLKPGRPCDLAGELGKLGIRYLRPRQLDQQVAGWLAAGETVGVVRGSEEFGPRALGHRSILAPADDPGIHDRLNRALRRTDFMPFAPVMQLNRAYTYLTVEELTGCEHTAQFMTISFTCSPKLVELCPAVVHTDGTARVQVVDEATDPFLASVLEAYERETGRPAIINTSFNVHDEPIVSSWREALVGFFQCGLDHLVLEDLAVSRRDNRQQARLLSMAQGGAERVEQKRREATSYVFGRRILERRDSPP